MRSKQKLAIECLMAVMCLSCLIELALLLTAEELCECTGDISCAKLSTNRSVSSARASGGKAIALQKISSEVAMKKEYRRVRFATSGINRSQPAPDARQVGSLSSIKSQCRASVVVSHNQYADPLTDDAKEEMIGKSFEVHPPEIALADAEASGASAAF
jgi:hypothetical protein